MISSQQDLDTAVELADTIPRYPSLRLVLAQAASPTLPPGRLGDIFRPPHTRTDATIESSVSTQREWGVGECKV